jgi:hypothetical protein
MSRSSYYSYSLCHGVGFHPSSLLAGVVIANSKLAQNHEITIASLYFSIICLILKSTLVREKILAGGGIDLSAAVLSKPRDQFVPFIPDPEMIWFTEFHASCQGSVITPILYATRLAFNLQAYWLGW